jgi:hypothetical protein
MRSIGYPELLVIVALGVFLVFPAWKIFSKAGYPGILSLALLVPILNLVIWWFLALSEWPVLRELNALRQRTTPSRPPLR